MLNAATIIESRRVARRIWTYARRAWLNETSQARAKIFAIGNRLLEALPVLRLKTFGEILSFADPRKDDRRKIIS